MAQLRLLLVTVAGMVVVMTSVLPTVVISACTCAPEQNSKENIADLTGKLFDHLREDYCEQFGKKIAPSGVDAGVWPTILNDCIGQLKFDDSNPYLPRRFPEVSEDMNQMIKDMHNSCSRLVSSPCEDSKGWKQLKRCVHERFMKEDMLSTSGQPDDDELRYYMGKFSLGTASSIFECTSALL